MLIALNIIPTTKLDLNIIMADVMKAQEQKEFFPENFQEQNEGTRVINTLGKHPNEAQKFAAASGRNTCRPEEIMKEDDDQSADSEGISDAKEQKNLEPILMLLEDQEIEEWNLGLEDEPKTIRINKNLSPDFKEQGRIVFKEYKDLGT